MSTSDYNLSGDEEVIAKPKGREYTIAEEEAAQSEMNFYNSSKWFEIVQKWREDHPLYVKQYTPKELEEADRIVREANETWKKIKEEKEKVRQDALVRIGRDK